MMGKILRIVSVERGYDPRGFTLVAFGGAGPMHVCPLAEELEVNRIIVPPNPGMFSALGLLTADLFHDYVRPVVKRVSAVDPARCRDGVPRDGDGGESDPQRRRRPRRGHELPPSSRPPIHGAGLRARDTRTEEGHGESLAATVIAFHRRHTEAYGYAAESEPVELVSLRLRAVGAIPKPALKGGRKGTAQVSGKRHVYFETNGGWADTPVIQRGEGWMGTV